jgi:hypothetical protein
MTRKTIFKHIVQIVILQSSDRKSVANTKIWCVSVCNTNYVFYVKKLCVLCVKKVYENGKKDHF